MLQSFKGQLPFTTRTLIWLSHGLTTYGGLIALIIIVFAVTYGILLRRVRSFRLFMNSILLRLPLLGKLFKYYYVANFCRTLGILLKGDVRIVEAVSITAKSSSNLTYQDALLDLSEGLIKGEKLSTFLGKHENLFPITVHQMITVGESTGSLSDSLLYLANIYEDEVDELTKNLSTSIEPMLMIFMGILVGFIALSIITPIYSLTSNLSNYH